MHEALERTLVRSGGLKNGAVASPHHQRIPWRHGVGSYVDSRDRSSADGCRQPMLSAKNSSIRSLFAKPANIKAVKWAKALAKHRLILCQSFPRIASSSMPAKTSFEGYSSCRTRSLLIRINVGARPFLDRDSYAVSTPAWLLSRPSKYE